jgi:hypothetical protein
LGIIAGQWSSANDLRKWWYCQPEKDMRASLVITGSTPEHRLLYNAYCKRGNELATSSHIRDAAE